MKLSKALTETGMARSGAEAQRLVKQGAVLVGGCIPPCNMRRCCGDNEESHLGEPCPLPVSMQFKCTCENWRKVTNPIEEIDSGEVMRIGDGGWRLLKREGVTGFDQVPGIARFP
jgi:hypothetical protein